MKRRILIILIILIIAHYTNFYLIKKYHKTIYFSPLFVKEVMITDYYKDPVLLRITDRKKIKQLVNLLRSATIDYTNGFEGKDYLNNGGRNFITLSIQTSFNRSKTWIVWKSPNNDISLFTYDLGIKSYTCNPLEEWLVPYADLDDLQRNKQSD